jgi:DNA-binding transcriptional MerR regulator
MAQDLHAAVADSAAPLSVPASARLRSGAAARLAGVPVATLRVWERRYAVVAAPKTPTGQRLYSGQDVARLRLLKLLRDRGHAIGSIAALDLASLQALDAAGQPEPVPQHSRRVVIVGPSAALRLKPATGCELLAVFEDLDQAQAQIGARLADEAAGIAAEPAAPLSSAEVLLVHLPSLQPASAARVLALGTLLKGAALIVIYAFGPEAVAQSLRGAGVTVQREPATGRELARLITIAHAPLPKSSADPARLQAAPRRFSDAELVRLAALPTEVACECPRHLCEIVTQLTHFERYSADCQATNAEDLALHQQLTSLAGIARTLFEQALEKVMADINS